MRDYLSPQRDRVALITIDAQRDIALPRSPAKAGARSAAVPGMRRLVELFRAKDAPIIHAIRLYRCDGSNVDLFHRASIEEGQRIVMPGTSGAELVDTLKPDGAARLDAELLFDGQLQEIGGREWVMYKPRSSAFYQTRLEDHLRALGITTLVICGCNFPNGPRATIYAGTNRDFRTVLITDAVCGGDDPGFSELAQLGVYLMSSEQCVAWLTRDSQAAA